VISLVGVFEQEIDHPLLGKIPAGTTSYEYYWWNRWFSVFRFIEPTGELRIYYCNVNVPPEFDGHEMSFIDLDIDIVVAPDMTFRIVDEDEFAENALRFGYPEEFSVRINTAIHELTEMIEQRQFPFNIEP
jgi:hypothetical protein